MESTKSPMILPDIQVSDRKILKDSGYKVIEYKKTTTYLLVIFQQLITYLVQEIAPSRKRYYYIFQILLIFPLSVTAYALNLILPKIMICFVQA